MAQEATRGGDIRPAINDVDRPAEETEQQMTDDERFSLLISVVGTNVVRERDARIPEGVPISAAYARGVSRPGVPRG
jgi:beta-glucosidase